MIIKNKQLGTVAFLAKVVLPKSFNARKKMQVAQFAKSVREKLELLNDVEMRTAEELEENYNMYQGFTGPDALDKKNEYEKKLKELYDDEIEVVNFPSFTLEQWPDLPANGFQIAELLELGIIKEKENDS